eukprot:TRINITY_DN1066_c0_g3_i2.p1 TRINITY_DN1066_c0_g3~~TRINITY_DN1066_c0_g3_i2.p1  ORF type:complete len:277 (+),score=79.09 TRINITY_DN1066_c0_g3_i2:78-908(+)
MLRSLVGSEMCIRDRVSTQSTGTARFGSMSLSAQEVAALHSQANSDPKAAISAINAIKLKLALASDEDTPEQLALQRGVFEAAAMINIRDKNVEEFARHLAILKSYYVDRPELPLSEGMPTILGLNLLRLLAQGSLDEFHTELETIPAEVLSTGAIQFPVQLEQLSMEGSYHKVMHFRQQLPSPEYSVFMDTLADTLRDEIASCCEKAYKNLPATKAAELLMLDANDLGSYCEERGWVMRGDKIDFVTEIVEKCEIPAIELIEETLHYATELDRIV